MKWMYSEAEIVNENYMVDRIKWFCYWWHTSEEKAKIQAKELWINIYSFEAPRNYEAKWKNIPKPAHKFSEAKSKRMLQEEFMKVRIWGYVDIHWYYMSDFDTICTRYLTYNK